MTLLLTLLKIVLALIAVAGALLVGALTMNRVPLLDPPGLSERLHTYLTTHVAEISYQARFPELQVRDDTRDAATLYADALRAVEKLGWEVIRHDEGPQQRIDAVVTSLIWKYRDDVAIWTIAQPDGGSRLYARAQSRVGQGDLGANTRHLRKLIEAVGTAPAPQSN